jgi:hypothetical protein
MKNYLNKKFQDAKLTPSILRKSRTPEEWYYKTYIEEEEFLETEAMRVGSAWHIGIFEKQRFNELVKFLEFPAKTEKSQKYQDFLAEKKELYNNRNIVILPDKYKPMLDSMINKVHSDIPSRWRILIKDGYFEKPYKALIVFPNKEIFQKDYQLRYNDLPNNTYIETYSEEKKQQLLKDDRYFLKISLRPDFINKSFDWTTEGKTDADVSPQGFERKAYKEGYHIQLAMYNDVVSAIEGVEINEAFFVCQENKAPYFTGFFWCSKNMLEFGSIQWRIKAYKIMKSFINNEFGGFAPTFSNNDHGIVNLDKPRWAHNYSEF